MKSVLSLLALAFMATLASASEPIVIADFEGANYGPWKSTGTAFGSGPAHGKLDGQMPVEGFQGQGLVNTFNGGDGNNTISYQDDSAGVTINLAAGTASGPAIGETTFTSIQNAIGGATAIAATLDRPQ